MTLYLLTATLYWSDIGSQQIMRSNLTDLRTSEIVLKAGVNNVDGLAIDPNTRKLYWTGKFHHLPLKAESFTSNIIRLLYRCRERNYSCGKYEWTYMEDINIRQS